MNTHYPIPVRGIFRKPVCFFLLWLVCANYLQAQPVDYSNCPTCTTQDIQTISDVHNLYQGLKGFNPTNPSTYNLIGKRKYSGSGWPVFNSTFGENWYPIRTAKQHLTGLVYRFGIANYGDESDWNIHIVPDPGFRDLIADALPYRTANWHGFFDEWDVTPDGHITIEAEITPDEHRYGNPWFNNFTGKSTLINRRITVYGPFVREEAHGNWPEIHPCEQLWWKEGDNTYKVLLLNDDSNRFDDRADTVVYQNGKYETRPGDYTARRVTTYGYQPWSPNRNQEAELWVAFEINPALGGMKMDVQALDKYNIFQSGSFADVTEGDKYSISYQGNIVLTVQESPALDPFTSISFKNVCFNTATGMLQGYVAIKTSVGNGNGSEGFVALQIDKKNVPLNAQPVIMKGGLNNQWAQHASYNDQVVFSEIITSDKWGKGMVDGMIDFNGNGVTDFFTVVDGRWLVMYDGVGEWVEINNSTIPVTNYRFGDVTGNGKTDIMRMGPNYDIYVSDDGVGGWRVLTGGGQLAVYFQVVDFNGDNVTDLVYFKNETNQFNQVKGYMYVKYSGAGSWKRIGTDYNMDNNLDYYNNFRFGDFNGDGITDIFRHSNARLGVYWNGAGSYRELTRAAAPLNMNDLVFVPNMAQLGYTDLLYVNRANLEWTPFYRSAEQADPIVLKYNAPENVHFGDLNGDGTWEILATDYVSVRVPPTSIVQEPVAPAVHEASVMTRYIAGSLKKTTVNGAKGLSLNMGVEHFPGTTTVQQSIVAPGSLLEWVRDAQTGQGIPYVLNPSFNLDGGEPQRLASISNINLKGAIPQKLEIKLRGQPTPRLYKIPTLGLKGELSNVREKNGLAAHWQTWKQYIEPNASVQRVMLLDSAPAIPVYIDEVQFEIVPLYSNPEEGKITMEEIDEVATQMNIAAYSYDTAQFNSLFNIKNVFDINWVFELKDLNTGAILPAGSMVVTKGRWNKSKVIYSFPATPNLLQLTATATITDEYGHTTLAPQSYTFYNQKIQLTNFLTQVNNWLLPLSALPVREGFAWVRDHWERLRANEHGFSYSQTLNKAKYLADDNKLTPWEVNELISVKIVQ